MGTGRIAFAAIGRNTWVAAWPGYPTAGPRRRRLGSRGVAWGVKLVAGAVLQLKWAGQQGLYPTASLNHR